MEVNASKKPEKYAKIKDMNKFGYYFIAPFFLVFIIFNLYPTLNTIYLSFYNIAGFQTEGTFVGLMNYTNLLKNSLFIQAIKNTLVLWTMNFIPQIVISMILAYWFTNARLKLKGQTFFKSAFYLPNIITAASVAVIFYALFSYPKGPINLLLINLGIFDGPYDFFRNVGFTRGLVSFIQFWMWYGQTAIVLVSGILSIDASLYEAAEVDGATPWQSFRKITLPLLKPITLYVLITSLVGGLQMFDIPLLLTNGGPNGSVETVMTYIYKQAFQGGRNISIASAASIYLLLMTIVLSVVIFMLVRDKKEKKG
ncbi:carbohydrate ABC transporter permease [Fundicoccus ignavus]|uniref:ABC transporter permease subunit n=1 Tax=Fundicoccus ignavus TaxID=2664442 RepID=A0A6I2GZR7_9LACT|nr:sugar ABC transporter permease [Fundicoccus ignavus]MRI85923.1 ABC transporter permease subunit [Fundicoccus ignavus]MRJ48412.1 ABC transporter permease subunit [Fundicoccus ignavus]